MTTKPEPPATTKRPVPKPPARARRQGCGTYCRAASILNGGLGDGQPAVTVVPGGTAVADADGYAPVVLTCNLTVQLRGAVVLGLNRPDFQEQEYFKSKNISRARIFQEQEYQEQEYIAGKSDVVVDAGTTTTLGVPLDAVALSWLQSRGPTDFTVLVDAGPSFGCDGSAWGRDAPTRLGLPPCGTGEGAPVIDGFALGSAGVLNVAAPG